LQDLTAALLDRGADPGSLRQAAQGLYDLLASASGFAGSAADTDQEKQLAGGVAISARDAARCVLDFARTAGFLRGVDAAIQEVQERHRGRPVRILYAGCGPFAPLVLPLCTRYGSDEMRLTLLEVNEGALACARRTFASLDFTDRVEDFVHGDAAAFGGESGATWDVCVIEVMQMALGKEPQVAVAAQLAPLLVDDGVLVPQRITLTAELADLAVEFSFLTPGSDPGEAGSGGRVRVPLGSLLTLERESAAGLLESAISAGDSSTPLLPAIELAIPEGIPAGRLTPIIRTRIQIAPSLVLGDYDSGLTVPQVMQAIGHVNPGELLAFQYRLGERPGFVAARVD